MMVMKQVKYLTAILSSTSAFLWAAFASAACPTANPQTMEAYIYGCPQASSPYASSLFIPAVPSSTTAPTSSMLYIPGNLLATLGDTQTLTNKTLTNPVINLGSDATGDLYYRNSGGLFTRLPIGSAAQLLEVVGGLPSWQTVASGGGTVGSGTGPQIAQYPGGTSTVVGGVTVSGDATLAAGGALTLATVNSNVGQFAIATFDAKGRATAATNMTGDVTTSGAAATLATVNSNVGSWTNANITVDAKGRITAAANGSGGSGTPTQWVGTFAGGPTAYTMSSTTPSSGYTNAAYNMVCGIMPSSATANTGTATLSVFGQTALAISKQNETGPLALAQGDIPAQNQSICFQVNAAANAFILQTNIASDVSLDNNNVVITPQQFAVGQMRVEFGAGPNPLTYTFPATTTLSANGTLGINTGFYGVTIVTNGSDQFNGFTCSSFQPQCALAPSTFVVITTDAAGHLQGNPGEVQSIGTSFYNGMPLSTQNVSFIAAPGHRQIISIGCTIDVVAGGAAALHVYKVPSGTSSGTPGSPGGTELTDTQPCDATVASTNQVLTTGTISRWTLNSGDRLMLVATGTWPNTASGNVTVHWR